MYLKDCTITERFALGGEYTLRYPFALEKQHKYELFAKNGDGCGSVYKSNVTYLKGTIILDRDYRLCIARNRSQQALPHSKS